MAERSPVALTDLPRLPQKEVAASTWVWGTAETVTVVALMVAGYWFSGRLARRRAAAAAAAAAECRRRRRCRRRWCPRLPLPPPVRRT